MVSASTVVALAAASARKLLPLALLAAGPAGALQVYTASGSLISGNLAGTSFLDARWSVTAEAEEDLSTHTVFTVPSLGTFDLWWLNASPRLTIEGDGLRLQADLLPSNPFRWLILYGQFPVGPSPKIGFVFTTPGFFPERAAGLFGVSGAYTDLREPLSLLGPSIFEAGAYPTSLGALLVNAPAQPGPGRFRIDAVPAPLPLLGSGIALGWSRRLRRRAGARQRHRSIPAHRP